jgi:pimeloyl-ACP methyl ester carboxylesterase
MPKLGMSMHEGRVVEWPVSLGGFVEKGQPLLVIESEKAEVELEATAAGHLRHIYVQPEETVPCGTLLAALTETPDEEFDPEAFRREHDRPEPPPAVVGAAAKPRASAPAVAPVGRAAVTPAARRRARELGLDPAAIPPGRPGGRVTVEDVEAYAVRARDRVEVASGVALEVPRQGSGPPLLLLPGFGTDVAVFARQIPPLAEDFEVFGVNPRGVGGSDAPEADRYDVAQGAADAAAVASGPAHVVGTSLGAAVALELALRHPERVRSLALLAPFAAADGRLLAVVEAWCRLAAEASSETLAAALMPWFFSPGTLADAKQRDLILRGLAATLARVSPAALERTAAGLRGWHRRLEDFHAIRIPTLVLVGGADLLTPGGEALAGAIPDARCLVVPDAGHALGLEAPDPVNAALREHLAALG